MVLAVVSWSYFDTAVREYVVFLGGSVMGIWYVVFSEDIIFGCGWVM